MCQGDGLFILFFSNYIHGSKFLLSTVCSLVAFEVMTILILLTKGKIRDVKKKIRQYIV